MPTKILKTRLNSLLEELSTRSTYQEEETTVRYTYFNENIFGSEDVESIRDIKLHDDCIRWVSISGLKDRKDIIKLQDTFDIHPLVIEDLLTGEERTKLESYEGFLFVVCDNVDYTSVLTDEELEFGQISFILKKDLLISVEEREDKLFDRIINKLEHVPAFRPKSTDALLFTLMDKVVDNYFSIFDIIGQNIDEMEEFLINDEMDEETLPVLYRIKKDLIYLRKTLWPLRSVVNDISKIRYELIDMNTSVYFRDVYDHIIQMLEFVEVYRDMTNSLIDAFDTSVTNRTNEVMMILTLWSTIFLPLTFITGVYGMNFHFMPELYQPYAYPLFWVISITIVITMITYFKRKGWI